MTDMTENADTNGRLRLNYIILLAIYGLLFLAVVAYTTGYLVGHFSRDDISMSSETLLKLSAMTLAIIVFGYATYRTYKNRDKSGGDLTPKEKLNRNILIWCGAIGGVIGLILTLVSDDFGSDPWAAFKSSPVPPILAIILASLWAIIMPIMVFFWEKKAIDEQEIYAYRTGAYYAAYAYLIGAPSWWILWRGGLTIEPNGMAIFIIFNFIWLITWIWKKYRG